ncbi:related to VPS72 - component of the SWR1 complex, required for vacuolar protein sorting [Ustilago trichophora]|uniref:Related to VPS72 - component of the SWR1 complex, required for vacuolar protein sorting n=1 Tax=Ustilago trichophora TaxID=86804 RepID=A0A5C3ENF8_9BASI|nr:related to VPS72 - component of the SWR1 complex, required for vacuolar protein sorting [Ustilago trichophora]
MSHSRSSPIAGSSRTPSPDPQPSTSYRIERFDPVQAARSNDLMVTSRSKRSTAGNRLKALLDQELEKDEIFAEVENDIDFEAKEDEDGVDIVDSDFDRDSDDDARNADEDESEGEREIEAAEKAEKQKRRAAARAVGIVKRPTAAPRVARRPLPASTSSAAQEETPARRRRISFAPDQPSSSSSPAGATSTTVADSNRRTSARAATVASKLEVESRLEEASQRRAAQPAKVAVKKKASLTQDALIAEALEVEEENRESLRRFLEQEEERRAKQRQRKERITGPFVRWMSVGLRVKVVEEIAEEEQKKKEEEKKRKEEEEVVLREAEKDKVKEIEGSQKEHAGVVEEVGSQAKGAGAQPRDASDGGTAPGSVQAVEEGQVDQESKTGSVSAEAADSSAPVPEIKPQQEAVETTKPSSIGDGDVPMAEVTAKPTKASTPPPPEAPSTALPPATASPDVTAEQPSASTAVPSTQPTTSSSSLTLDPAIAARKEAVALRTSSQPLQPSKDTPSHPNTSTSSTKTELQSRTILTLERAPEDYTWLDEYNALLGDHCTWDSFPYVPSRNRPLKPRQSICPITGLPAIYRDPRTGIPYANAEAYKVLTKVLEGRFLWTGGRFESARVEGAEKEKGKKRDRGIGGEKEAGGGRMGKGAVPVEMGIYVDDENELGPGKVWETARTASQSKSIPSTTTTTAITSKDTQSSSSSFIKTPLKRPEPSPSQQTPEAEEAAKKKSKPGFDVILTNAIAPGDEKAVLAAALSLPAGSTRSGRRVQRS